MQNDRECAQSPRMKSTDSARPKRLLYESRHAVFLLEDDLLLVFKPSGHTESAHQHDRDQSLRVLRGSLQLDFGGHVRVVHAGDDAVVVPAGSAHATRALTATWLLVQWQRSDRTDSGG